VPALLEILKRIQSADRVHRRLGLQPDQWNYKQLVGYAEPLAKSRRAGRNYALTVLGAYTEVLESRSNERQLIADRLLIFEDVMKEFLDGKRVFVDATKGLRIETDQEEELDETKLSSGEYHLLYLMVAALTTKRSGTVIAIDEPEMSMHIEWQRKLIRKLFEVASNAAPQFVFATHSPDVAADYPDDLIELRFKGQNADSAHS
jgi:predicted ATPase